MGRKSRKQLGRKSKTLWGQNQRSNWDKNQRRDGEKIKDAMGKKSKTGQSGEWWWTYDASRAMRNCIYQNQSKLLTSQKINCILRECALQQFPAYFLRIVQNYGNTSARKLSVGSICKNWKLGYLQVHIYM